MGEALQEHCETNHVAGPPPLDMVTELNQCYLLWLSLKAEDTAERRVYI